MISLFQLIVSLLFFKIGIATAHANYSELSIPQIKYKEGLSNPHPTAIDSLLSQIERRTSIETNRGLPHIALSDSNLYQYPLIYMAGGDEFEMFSAEELQRLRNYLSYGGFLFVDGSSSDANSKFDISVRKMIGALFAQVPLKKIPRDHSIFRSFYLINRVSGRKQVSSYLEGISIKGRTVLVYSTNDLGGAWARGRLGEWTHDIIGGGRRQRQLAIRLGVNIVMYALTLDYKKDMVHLPIILERLKRHQLP
ncbi:MAG: DUF4159 domain-containing protein [Nitrospina sp.]|nr:DUF4159 domain-containing protein [Nitrospina sp.]